MANSLVILSKGVPQMMAGFRLRDFLNDFGCKLVFCVQRVARAVSVGTTCLLSVFKAIHHHQPGTPEENPVCLQHCYLFSDVFSLGPMLGASGSTVFILHRHQQRVQHIHGTHVVPRTSPETRATRTTHLGVI
ncbi:vomeronasal type-1 receptor 3-like, partial [Rhinolophus sinicus]|uniref:vomeronasal type-1 receptor 3-like n=1 Tax=Rhinolophus sinicus TaxID=89399 RepID=UPI003D7ABAD4